jgi:hypothetical protein
MVGIRNLVCAVALFLGLLAGCANLDLASVFLLQSDASGRDRLVAGSLDAVAESAQSSLTQLGLSASVTRQGESVRIASRTSSGAHFTLVLTREKGKDGEQTRVRIEWDGGSEDQVGFQLLSQIESLHRK